MDDLNRLRRLAGMLTESENPFVKDEECEPEEEDCVEEGYSDIAESYARFMAEAEVELDAEKADERDQLDGDVEEFDAMNENAGGKWYVRHQVRGMDRPEEEFDDEVSAKGRASDLLKHAAVSSVSVGPKKAAGDVCPAGGAHEWYQDANREGNYCKNCPAYVDEDDIIHPNG